MKRTTILLICAIIVALNAPLFNEGGIALVVTFNLTLIVLGGALLAFFRRNLIAPDPNDDLRQSIAHYDQVIAAVTEQEHAFNQEVAYQRKLDAAWVTYDALFKKFEWLDANGYTREVDAMLTMRPTLEELIDDPTPRYVEWFGPANARLLECVQEDGTMVETAKWTEL
ncbi:hypothetical protein DYU11_20200 [Fibrisoma montanum]|uniref:Uncharacterized protein n=1 Tax=Fibrisoma montanum TaxID=2305895 RepID=A0A418M3H9_9BACT|nr:hypothetical protein [Fibrisoma montanum]RIV20375.1 hypothetical protein DYU11_20200 [Fibrisoma montanum]